MRRAAFWLVVLSPLVIVALAFLGAGVLELIGADCVTYGNNPMHLDNDTVCNDLGDHQTALGWSALLLAMLLLPITLATGAVGAWRFVARRSK
jgi:uncharacterized membrane protein YhaH (DUF805 family)